ncbi:hypothetical protein DPMN_038175 [Dreissena polymorpha]|uniref:Uncharacterized protein n=1 Tax=Dreissena polymorpha TaxID=45954 RepID=A0A9D4RPX9_DREPO|nr:hypothetical protein DPMN_038175 [Dreissena polymorpha]
MASTMQLESLFLNLLSSKPVELNTLSDGTDVAGTESTRRATTATFGNCALCRGSMPTDFSFTWHRSSSFSVLSGEPKSRKSNFRRFYGVSCCLL